MTAAMPEPPDFPEDDAPPARARALAPVAPTSKIETRLCRMSAEEYHRDPCVTPSLSASIAHVLDTESPAHAWTRHPRFGGISRPDTKTFDAGTLAHLLLLGEGREVEIVFADDWKTKAAREARDAARERGALPVLEAVYQEATDTADTLRQRFADLGIVLDGESELAAFWGEESTYGPVQCRGMLDHWKPTGLARPTVYDLKSCRSASLSSIQRSCDSFGYASQRAAYVSAIEHVHPELAGRVDYIPVFFELAEPFVVTPIRFSGAFRELGERRWKASVETWARCIRLPAGSPWPAYVDSITELDPPPWALARDMDRQLATRNWETEVPFGGDES